MKPYDKVGKIVVKMLNSTVNFAVLILLLLLLFLGVYSLWDSKQVYQVAQTNQYDMYKPTSEEVESFADLQAINSEVIAWLTIYGTNVDYPIAQASNNSKYVNTNIKNEYSLSGALFLDCDNSPEFLDFNSIIYGHHMDKDVMLGGLEYFGDKEYFDARRYGSLFYSGRAYGIEFFAFMEVDAYDYTVYNVNITAVDGQQFIDNLLSKSKHIRDIGLNTSDRILLLSTCTSDSTNGRHILAGRITDENFADIFYEAEVISASPYRVDSSAGIRGMIERMSRFAWVLLVIVVLLIFIICDRLYKRLRQKRNKKRERENEQKTDEKEN
jgi:sortase, SrtB family